MRFVTLVGACVALDPGGFWQGWETPFFEKSVVISIKLMRALRPVLPLLTGNALTRTALFVQFSARPLGAAGKRRARRTALVCERPIVRCDLARPRCRSAPDRRPAGSLRSPLVIGWGRADRVCMPVQASRALDAFPDARLHWFEKSGHFPQWDAPEETVRLILQTTA